MMTATDHIQAYLNAKKFERDAQDVFDPVCSVFGCGRILTLSEHLAGNKCTEHMNTKPININLIIKTK